ncbi:carbohydrate ABC transporter permease [Leifsonia poae]|uniref:carbohydrate ABC transporter permease n=1 Tax=Leifsonia poae TaxID=110933 RepID=UPI001CBCF855|nr:sugar ABC transporter permease [Leifsonia poae]
MISSLWTSLLNWDLLSPATFVGLKNYAKVLTNADFGQALLHTLYYLCGYVPLVLLGALVLALLLNTKIRGRGVFRAIYYLPVVTSWIVVALLWKWLLSPDGGIVNFLLGLVGISGPGWWTDPVWAMPAVIIASVWKDMGFNMLILLAGLQSIPTHLYEAARLDGAGSVKRLFYITLPLLTPSIFFVVVLSLIGGFQVFDQVYIMTGGGPAGSTTVILQQVVQQAFSYGDMGGASAMSWVLFAIILVFTLVQFRLQRRWVTYDA